MMTWKLYTKRTQTIRIMHGRWSELMAKMTVVGIDKLADDLKKMGDLRTKV